MNFDLTDKDYDRKKRAEFVLYNVLDPELMVNIIDLGLVYELGFSDEDNKINVLMTLTTPHCPMGEAIQTGVRNALAKEFPGYETQIELTFDPPWSFDKVSPEGRYELENRY